MRLRPLLRSVPLKLGFRQRLRGVNRSRKRPGISGASSGDNLGNVLELSLTWLINLVRIQTKRRRTVPRKRDRKEGASAAILAFGPEANRSVERTPIVGNDQRNSWTAF